MIRPASLQWCCESWTPQDVYRQWRIRIHLVQQHGIVQVMRWLDDIYDERYPGLRDVV